MILHIATHNMHHRGQLLYMLRRSGLSEVPEGDALSWELAIGNRAGATESHIAAARNSDI